MCIVTTPICVNCVGNFAVYTQIDKQKLTRPEDFFLTNQIVHHSNFYNVKVFGCTYTVFNNTRTSSPTHVGITGVPDESFLRAAAIYFACTFRIRRLISRGICNSTYHGRLMCVRPQKDKLELFELLAGYVKNPLKEQGQLNFTFRPHYFPGVTIKTDGHGTITLFNNGKYHMVGINSEEKAKLLRLKLCAIMRHCWRMAEQETSCAWGVV